MYYLGVDLGGTKIGIGLVDDSGKIHHKDSCPTNAGEPWQDTLQRMADLARSVAQRGGVALSDVAAAGVGSPGLIDTTTGEVVFANNLYWHNVPLGEQLSQLLGMPVWADNDANVAALAEVQAGSMRGASNALLLTLGTGVGGGIIIGGRIYAGTHNGGAELGHMCLVLGGIECTCGNRGCVERYASATALIREGRAAAQANPASALYSAVNGDLDAINAKTVVDCARAGDADAVRVYNAYVEALGMTIISFINIFEPQSIALGGGVSAAGDFLLDAVSQYVYEHLFYKSLERPKVVLAELGNDAGIIGAAMIAKQGLADRATAQ